MGQSMGSVGGGKQGKQKGATDQQKNQPETRPGQKMSDQGGAASKGKPDGGADKGPRSIR